MFSETINSLSFKAGKNMSKKLKKRSSLVRKGKIRNERTGEIVSDKVIRADSFWLRLVGLIPREKLKEGEGLWLNPCNQVHTFFMRFPLSVWILDEQDRVCSIYDYLQPWRISPYYRKGYNAIEFPAGWGERTKVQIEDFLIWRKRAWSNK